MQKEYVSILLQVNRVKKVSCSRKCECTEIEEEEEEEVNHERSIRYAKHLFNVPIKMLKWTKSKTANAQFLSRSSTSYEVISFDSECVFKGLNSAQVVGVHLHV